MVLSPDDVLFPLSTSFRLFLFFTTGEEQAGTDPFGFGFPWATFDTTSHGAGLVVMASEYNHLTGTNAYASYGFRWLANILGANAWGVSLIVGDGSTFPHCMQHQVANLAGSLDGSPPILAGAAVEGPNKVSSKGLVSGMVSRSCSKILSNQAHKAAGLCPAAFSS